MNIFNKISRSTLLCLGIILGLVINITVTQISAHGGDTSLIHACVKNSNGSFRFVDPNEACAGNETAVDWPKMGGSGLGVFGGFVTDQLIGYEGSPFEYRYFAGGNFTDAIMNYGPISSDLSNTNFTNSNWNIGSMKLNNFTNANFTGAQLLFSDEGSNFTNVNFTDVSLAAQNPGDIQFTNSNFTNANFTNTDLSGDIFTNTTTTGAIWSNTTCPDGTNSDNSGNTCEGHLVP